MRLAVKLAYDGAPFHGFARQPGQTTVQGELERALSTVFRREVLTTCAGRTDAGVHARSQVVDFEICEDEWRDRTPRSLVRSLRALTPDGVIPYAAAPVPDDFSARFSAVTREYRYFLCCDERARLMTEGRAWQLGFTPDVEAMRDAAAHLVGEHDFKSFCMAVSAEGKSTVRCVESVEVLAADAFGEPVLCIRVVGNAFLHSMVRTMVGSLVLVGRGKRHPDWMAEVLAARDRSAAGENAPAEGLVLWDVAYDPDPFASDAPSAPAASAASADSTQEA